MATDTGVVNIRGKEYKTVALRVGEFRERWPAYSLTTEIVDRDADTVVVKATVSDESGRVLATGHAEETRTGSGINSTSAVENCETSAIGRALAALGLAGHEFASADEVQKAIDHQNSGRTVRPPRNDAPPQTDYAALVDRLLMDEGCKGEADASLVLSYVTSGRVTMPADYRANPAEARLVHSDLLDAQKAPGAGTLLDRAKPKPQPETEI